MVASFLSLLNDPVFVALAAAVLILVGVVIGMLIAGAILW